MKVGPSLLQEMKINDKLFVLNYQVFYMHIYLILRKKARK
jgi:hypothetical protein